jgi:hypothetical protein
MTPHDDIHENPEIKPSDFYKLLAVLVILYIAVKIYASFA